MIGKLKPEDARGLLAGRGRLRWRRMPRATARSAPSASAGAAAWSISSRCADPDLAAGVAYYGRQAAAADVPKIKAPLMLHYAGLDERINAGIADYEAALKANGKTYELYMYEGANHAFNNDTNAARYNKEAADLAWGRTVAFLKKNAGLSACLRAASIDPAGRTA